jgi:rhodanese-related sulfurtransferase
MSAPTADAITSDELREQLESSTAPRVVDVRTPAEFETSHIPGSHNVPLDVLDEHTREIAELLNNHQEIVLVCRSGQRSTKAQNLLWEAGLAARATAYRLGGSGCPYTATTTVRSMLLSDHTPIAVLAQSRMIAMSSGL